MTGPEFRAIRKKLGLTLWEWGLVLGYRGTRNTIQGDIREYESGEREIRPMLARLALMYLRHGVPRDFVDAQ